MNHWSSWEKDPLALLAAVMTPSTWPSESRTGTASSEFVRQWQASSKAWLNGASSSCRGASYGSLMFTTVLLTAA